MTPRVGFEIALVEQVGRQERDREREEKGLDGHGVVDEAVVHSPEGRQLVEAPVLQIPSVMPSACDLDWRGRGGGKVGHPDPGVDGPIISRLSCRSLSDRNRALTER